MTEAAVNMSYEAYSEEPEYIEMNRAFVRTLELSGVDRLLDLACGTGLMSDLVLEARGLREILALDLAREQLELMREHFRGKEMITREGRQGRPAGAPGFLLVEGSADTLPFASGAVDLVLMGNSIHNLPDRDRLLGEICRVLRPGGRFGFNSVFYAGTYVPGTEKFYQEWVQEALAFVMNRDREEKAQGLPGIRRKRGTGTPAFSKRWLTPPEWAEALARHGLEVTRTHERTSKMTRSNFELVGSYAGLAAVLMSGYPIRLACEALKASVAPALERTGFTTVPRNWLEMTAMKPRATGPGAGAER